MNLTNDQYNGLTRLLKWYYKYTQQFIEISGVVGTGILDLIRYFLSHIDLNPKEIIYLSSNQKEVLELAYQKYHSYYINGIIYNYTRIVDFDTIPVLNPFSKVLEYEWKKEIRKKLDPRYKMMVIFDSSLLNQKTISDLGSFGLPIILVKDPMLLPAPDSYTFLREANIELHEIHEDYQKNPIIYFTNRVLNNERITHGHFDSVSIIPRKQLNLFNLRSTDMNITISDELSQDINRIYRERILKRKDLINVLNERVIIADTLYGHKITNPDNKKVKVYLTKGTVGYLTKVNRHAPATKYVPINFRPCFYHESFTDLVMDRHYLNHIEAPSTQIIPDEVIKLKYAYALTAVDSRLSYWDKVTLISDSNEEYDPDLQKRLLYTAMTRARKSLTIII